MVLMNDCRSDVSPLGNYDSDSEEAYNNICKTTQSILRDMHDSVLSSKADDIQSFADKKKKT